MMIDEHTFDDVTVAEFLSSDTDSSFSTPPASPVFPSKQTRISPASVVDTSNEINADASDNHEQSDALSPSPSPIFLSSQAQDVSPTFDDLPDPEILSYYDRSPSPEFPSKQSFADDRCRSPSISPVFGSSVVDEVTTGVPEDSMLLLPLFRPRKLDFDADEVKSVRIESVLQPPPLGPPPAKALRSTMWTPKAPRANVVRESAMKGSGKSGKSVRFDDQVKVFSYRSASPLCKRYWKAPDIYG